MTERLKAPFWYFGGKGPVADIIWSRFGDVGNYVEAFAGSAAVLLARPSWHENRSETINDVCGFVANFWRSVHFDAEAVAKWCQWPVFENDLHARHTWLLARTSGNFVSRLEGNPDFYDAKIAGWWCWGLCSWIGDGWCSGKGPWQGDGKRLTKSRLGQQKRIMPDIRENGRGVRKLGQCRQIPCLFGEKGIHRKRICVTNDGIGINRKYGGIYEWFAQLQARFEKVNVCCGDWHRVCGKTPTTYQGQTAVFLDPPYSVEDRCHCYRKDDRTVAHHVRQWAIEHGDDPLFRIALCGYDSEHKMPANWDCVAWKANGGYGNQGTAGDANAHRERIWFSPHCIKPDQDNLLF